MKRSLMAVLAIALLASALPQQGAAQDILPGERARAVRMACAADFQRYCRDVLPGGGRILRCLSRHVDLVTQPCFQALTAWGLTAVNAFKMCLPDVAALCPQVPPHSGPALACLQQNVDKLSKDCRDSLIDQDLLAVPNGSPPRRPGADPSRPGPR
jgi:Cysteine rich repeat